MHVLYRKQYLLSEHAFSRPINSGAFVHRLSPWTVAAKKACLEVSFVDELLIYAGLFASAFLAATILPAQSELGLAALLSMGTLPAFLLIAVASIGNILGAVANWVLGQKFEQLKSKNGFLSPQAS